MHQVQVNVVARKAGKKPELKKLRADGLVPANIYGPGIPNQSCALNEKELRKAFNNELEANLIIEVNSDSPELKGKKVILKHISRSPTWKVEHVDLYEISMTRPLTVSVPLHFKGIPVGVKSDGGVLQVIRRSLKIEALPADLPDFIEVDITELKLNSSFHVNELTVPAKVKVLDSGIFPVVAVNEPEKEEVVVAPVAAAEGAVAGEGTAAAASTAAAGAPAAAGAKDDAAKKK